MAGDRGHRAGIHRLRRRADRLSGSRSSTGGRRRSRAKRPSPKSRGGIASLPTSLNRHRQSNRRLCSRLQANGQAHDKTRAVDPRRRLCPPGRAGRRGRSGRGRPHPRRRDGRPFRAEPVDGPADRQVVAAGDAVAARNSPDDLRSRRHSCTSSSTPAPTRCIVHWEGNCNLHRTVERIKALGKRAGVAINPATPAAVLEEILPDVDQVLVMTVDPGFGHQPFLSSTLPKLRRVREMIAKLQSRLRSRGRWRDRRNDCAAGGRGRAPTSSWPGRRFSATCDGVAQAHEATARCRDPDTEWCEY